MDEATEQRIGRMETAITYASIAVTHARETLAAIEERLAELEGITCTGTPLWRDKDHPTKKPKFYVNHSVDECCPFHGRPESGKRLRVYVGIDGCLIARAQRAMALNNERVELERQQRIGRSRILNAERHLENLFHTLEWMIDREGHAKPSDKPAKKRW